MDSGVLAAPGDYGHKSAEAALHAIAETQSAIDQNQQLRAAAQKNPGDPNAAKALAQSNAKTQAAGEAAAKFTDNSQAQSIAAHAAAQLGDGKTAISRSNLAVGLAESQMNAQPKPGDPADLTPEQKAKNLSEALKTRAAISAAAGDVKSAAKDAARALDLFPGDEQARQIAMILPGHKIHGDSDVTVGVDGWGVDAGKLQSDLAQIRVGLAHSIVSNVQAQAAQTAARSDPNVPHSLAEWAERQERHPTEASKLVNSSMANLNRGNLDAALNDAEAAMKLSPNEAITHVQRGIVYTHLKRYDDAVTDLDTAIKRYGWSETMTYGMLAKALIEHGENRRAAKDFNTAMRLFRSAMYNAQAAVNFGPDDAAAHASLGTSQSELELAKFYAPNMDAIGSLPRGAARAELKKAAELDPRYQDQYKSYVEMVEAAETVAGNASKRSEGAPRGPDGGNGIPAQNAINTAELLLGAAALMVFFCGKGRDCPIGGRIGAFVAGAVGICLASGAAYMGQQIARGGSVAQGRMFIGAGIFIVISCCGMLVLHSIADAPGERGHPSSIN